MKELEDNPVLRVDGACTLASAAEWKNLLMAGLARGSNLRVDLAGAGEMDVAAMQLLWAAGHEAQRAGSGIAVRMTEAAARAAREAGFERIPGITVETGEWPR